MLVRLFHVVLSLAAVLATYALYSLLVVPWIVPPPPFATAGDTTGDYVRSSIQIERLRPYFEEGDWEIGEPIVVETPQFALLMKDYESLPSGQIRIQPCTIVFFPDGRPIAGQDGRVLIMRAPQGAVLDFDGHCDISRAKVGKLEGGRLVGEISITGNISETGPAGPTDSELMITTSNVEVRSDRIWNRNSNVQFRLGNNHGHGRGMEMLFDSHANKHRPAGGKAAHPVQSFELLHDVRLFVELESKGLLPGAEPKKGANPPTDEDSTPVEIQCAGAFRLDVGKMVATFNDTVHAVRHHPQGPADELRCDQLSLHFVDDPSGNAPGTDDAPASSIKANRLVAQGSPVTVRSPATGTFVQGDYLEVEFDSQRLALEGDQPVLLRHDSSELTANSIRYASDPNGALGSLLALGAGRLITILPGEKKESFEATWKDKLHIQPHESRHVLSIAGKARLQYAETGALQADKLWLWLDKLDPPQAPPVAAKPKNLTAMWANFTPHSALATTNVRLDSRDMSAASDRLEIWFERQKKNPANPQPNDAGPNNMGHGEPNPRPPSGARRPNRVAPVATAAAVKPRDSHYHISGRLMQVTIALPDDGQPMPTVANVSGDVKLEERMTAPDSGEAPLKISGDHLELFGADTPQTVVSVTGNPASAKGRGISITGAVLQLEKGTNRMWVNGAGGLRLPIDRDLEGKPLAAAESLDINWQGRMLFDGQVITFERNVTARTQQQQLQTAQLVVSLNRRLDFSERIEKDAIDVETIACHGGVLLDNQTVQQGQRVSRDRIQTNDLSIEQRTGRLQATGPGWVTSVRKNSANNPAGALAGGRPQQPVNARPAGVAGANGNNLVYLRVEFRGGIGGNLRQRELTFSDQVRCTYGPVRNWNDEINIDPQWGPRGNEVLMTCDQLSLRQMATGQRGTRAVELEAVGSANVEAETFAALGHHLTYSTGKELLVLEGTGQSLAHLKRRQHAGAAESHVAAQKFLYWRKDNRVEGQGIRSSGGSWPGR